jgi:hypothetical protein
MMNYDLAWLQDWATNQRYVDSGSMSWKVISEVIPNFPNHAVNIGPTEDGNYSISLTGPVLDGTPVIVYAAVK